MYHQLEIDGFSFNLLQQGRGPGLILLHGSGMSHRQWLPLIEHLSSQFTVFAPDLLGYGRSPYLPPDSETPLPNLQLIQELASMAGDDVHVVGHSFGAATGLQAVLERRLLPASLTLIEPVSFQLLDQPGYRDLWREVDALVSGVVQAVNDAKPRRAAKHFIRYWGGWYAWYLMPRKMRLRLIEQAQAIAEDCRSLYKIQHNADFYRRIECPVHLIHGEKTRPVTRQVIEEIAGLLNGVPRRSSIPGAGHMSPLTHAQEVNSVIESFLDKCSEKKATGLDWLSAKAVHQRLQSCTHP